MSTTQLPVFLDQRQVAEMLGLHVTTLRKWRSQSRGPKSYRIEGKVVYRFDEVMAWVEAVSSD